MSELDIWPVWKELEAGLLIEPMPCSAWVTRPFDLEQRLMMGKLFYQGVVAAKDLLEGKNTDIERRGPMFAPDHPLYLRSMFIRGVRALQRQPA